MTNARNLVEGGLYAHLGASLPKLFVGTNTRTEESWLHGAIFVKHKGAYRGTIMRRFEQILVDPAKYPGVTCNPDPDSNVAINPWFNGVEIEMEDDGYGIEHYPEPLQRLFKDAALQQDIVATVFATIPEKLAELEHAQPVNRVPEWMNVRKRLIDEIFELIDQETKKRQK